MKYSNRTTITPEEKLMLIGLLTLAKQHRDFMTELVKAVAKIIDEDDVLQGRSSDFVWSDSGDVDCLLELESITVIGVVSGVAAQSEPAETVRESRGTEEAARD